MYINFKIINIQEKYYNNIFWDKLFKNYLIKKEMKKEFNNIIKIIILYKFKKK